VSACRVPRALAEAARYVVRRFSEHFGLFWVASSGRPNSYDFGYVACVFGSLPPQRGVTDEFAGVFVPEAEPQGAQAAAQGQHGHLLEKGLRFMACF